MIYLKIGYSILGLLIITSCKQNSKTEQKVMLSSAKTDQEILKKHSCRLQN